MLVGDAYTMSPYDTMPAAPIGLVPARMSTDAIHEMPRPAKSRGAATVEQSSDAFIAP